MRATTRGLFGLALASLLACGPSHGGVPAAPDAGAPKDPPVDTIPPWPPPPGPTVCSAFDAYEFPVHSPARGGCDWVPAVFPPRTLEITPGVWGPLCYPTWTTGSGDIAAWLVGDLWALVTREGEVASRVSSPPGTRSISSMQPQMTTLVGQYLYDDPLRKIWRPVLASWAPDGTTSSVFLDRFEPFFHTVEGTQISLSFPAVGVALGILEFDQLTGGWRAMVWVLDERVNVCGVPWEADRGTDEFPAPFLGVDADLNVLVYYDGTGLFPGPQFARWCTIDGKPLTERFPAPVGRADCKEPGTPGAGICGAVGLVPLIGGGFAYQEGLQYRGFFPPREARMEPAPAWLEAYNGHELHRVGDRGYAAIPVVGLERFHVPCADHIDFVSATGESCGTMMLESPLECARIYVGRDGTVLQSSWRDPCRIAVWDHLLAP